MKKVSVIIPVYNQKDLVYRCLDSIPKRNDIEIIVINDGSEDKTLERLMKYKEFIYPELKIITYNENKGVSYARNMGIDESSGEYLLMVDSDDYLYGNKFDEIIDKHLNKADFIYYDMEDNRNNVFKANESNYKQRCGMFKFIRRSFIGDERFTVGMQYAEDKDFSSRLIDKHPSVYFTNILMYHYNYPRIGSLSFLGQNNNWHFNTNVVYCRWINVELIHS